MRKAQNTALSRPRTTITSQDHGDHRPGDRLDPEILLHPVADALEASRASWRAAIC
jgi:hypothetical protein